jgi:hypothetical protein
MLNMLIWEPLSSLTGHNAMLYGEAQRTSTSVHLPFQTVLLLPSHRTHAQMVPSLISPRLESLPPLELRLQLQELLNTHATRILPAMRRPQLMRREKARTGHTQLSAWCARRSIAWADALTTRDKTHNTNSERSNPPQLVLHALRSTPMLASLVVSSVLIAQSNSHAHASTWNSLQKDSATTKLLLVQLWSALSFTADQASERVMTNNLLSLLYFPLINLFPIRKFHYLFLSY